MSKVSDLADQAKGMDREQAIKMMTEALGPDWRNVLLTEADRIQTEADRKRAEASILKELAHSVWRKLPKLHQ
jgi:hypothetical protein